jgi:uncharacterized protein (TIGR02271 family)
MITTEQVQSLLDGNAVVLGQDGEKIGTVGQVFLDDETGAPEWVTAKTGLFGSSESFIPLQEASVSGDGVRVPYDKDMVKNAPRIDDSNGSLSQDEEARLYQYYGLNYSESRSDSGLPTGQSGNFEPGYQAGDEKLDRTGTVGHDTSGPTTDEAMTRSEERLNVGTQSREAGRVRLRKYVTSETVTQTVPVSHEEVRIEREPITDANIGAAMDGPALSEEEHEVTLTEQRPVVAKETVPVERVRLDKDTVTENVSVNEEVKKEQIEVDDDTRRS